MAFDRKSPPIAKGAKGGAPSSSDGERFWIDPRAQAGLPVPQDTPRRRPKAALTPWGEVTVECGRYGNCTDGITY